MNDLAAMYESQGNYGKAEALFSKVLEVRRRVLGPVHPVTLGTLTSVGRVLVEQQKYDEGEPFLREALSGHEKKDPDRWPFFNTESLLGAALAGEGKYVEAEPLLLSGYEGLNRREPRVPWPNRVALQQALDRLIQLYDDWGKPQNAAQWKQRSQLRAAGHRQ
jgi:non-specific serine/threonine protein kinase/serine/threonine-protein kinase